MQQILSKSRRLLFIAVLLLALALCFSLAMKIFHRINLVFITLVVLSALLIMVSGSPFRVFMASIISWPLSYTMSFDIGFTIIPGYILLMFLMFIMIVSREFWYSRAPLDFAVIAFIGVCALSIIQTLRVPPPKVEFIEAMRYRGVWFRSVIQFSLLCLFSLIYFFSVYFCSSNKKRLDIVLKVHIVTAIIISLYGIYQAFATHFDLPLKDVTNMMKTSGEGYGGSFTQARFGMYRSQATFPEPLGFGNYLLSVLPLSLAFGSITKSYIDLRERKWMSSGTLALVITLFFVAIFMTRSRGPLISLASSMLLMMLLLRKRHLPVLTGYIIISMSVLAVYYSMTTRYLGVSSDVMRVLRLGDISRALKAEEILQALSPGSDSYGSESALEELISGQRFVFNFYLVPKLFKQHPFMGVGLGNFPLHASSILKTNKLYSPVGLWAAILVELGLVGFAAFSWMIFVYYRTMILTLAKVRGTYWSPYIVGVLACFTGFMVHFLSWGSRLDYLAWLFMGISMAIVKLIDQDLNQNANDREPNTRERTTDVIRS
jgi:hypothetical protein